MAGYVIVNLEITDADRFDEYAEKIVDVVAAHGGKYIVRSDSVEVIAGDWTPDRVVVIEFESVERARGWISSPEYRELIDLRLGGANTSMVIVEGV